jgi:hypothetical protein
MNELELHQEFAIAARREFERNVAKQGISDPIALAVGRALLEATIEQERQKLLNEAETTKH